MTLYEYFKSTDNYFWQWEYDEDSEDVNAIGIPGGNTIVYKDMVVDIMDKLSQQGTPPFGVLLLFIIATNPNGASDIVKIDRKITDYLIHNKHSTNPNTVSVLLSMATQLLNLLTQIPKEYKVGANRILLFQTLLKHSHNKIGYQKIRPIIKAMQQKRYSEEELFSPIAFNESIFLKDFRVVGLLKKRFEDVEDIISKMGDIHPIEEELLIEETLQQDEKPATDFVQELIDNTNSFHVGSLLKRIWSGLNIPFHNILPSQQPIGGVSDLTNKGSFDRLLISEFANEDIVFLSRIANNEALYLNREIPPQSEDLARIILIDVSIKNWGTPKVLAHALMLAIAKHPKSKINCFAYAIGENVEPLNFTDIHEIIKGVQYLEGCLDASEGLRTFFKENPPSNKTEIFFITTEDASKTAAMQKVLSEHHTAINYWIYPDSEGKIELYKKKHNSRKHIQTLRLPLEELWTKKAKVEAVKELPKVDERKPIFYNILFPWQNKVKSYLPTSYGQNYFVVDNYLLADMGADKGWKMVYEYVPKGDSFEICTNSKGEDILLCHNSARKILTLINITNKLRKTVPEFSIANSTQKRFFSYGDSFYIDNFLSILKITLNSDIDIEQITKSKNPFSSPLHSLFTKRKEEQEKLQKSVSKQYPLKNIKRMYINGKGNLSFNAHEYVFNANMIYLHHYNDRISKNDIDASVNEQGDFEFSNGYTVSVNRLGILILTSYKIKNIPQHIFLPTIERSPLGVASDMDFAGSSFYHISDERGREPIKIDRFWNQYIIPFIKDITDYESKNRAISSK
ncbi:MAG: hypothetical protein MUF58_11920 [Arcicella sp.]|jgi:hypothetical protein|nr:hypothetical protein [Arcicella sp.]